jgi:hypothetical protein
MHFQKGDTTLRLFTTIATLGTPQDITLQELRIESFFPIDDMTLVAQLTPTVDQVHGHHRGIQGDPRGRVARRRRLRSRASKRRQGRPALRRPGGGYPKASPRVSQFESPQLHQEVLFSGGRSQGPKISRGYKALTWSSAVCDGPLDSGHQEKPDAAYARYVWRKSPRSGPSLKVRVGRHETVVALSHEHGDPTPSVRELADFP